MVLEWYKGRLVLKWTCNSTPFLGGTGDWTEGLIHARRVLCHWATPPTLTFSFSPCSLRLLLIYISPGAWSPSVYSFLPMAFIWGISFASLAFTCLLGESINILLPLLVEKWREVIHTTMSSLELTQTNPKWYTVEFLLAEIITLISVVQDGSISSLHRWERERVFQWSRLCAKCFSAFPHRVHGLSVPLGGIINTPQSGIWRFRGFREVSRSPTFLKQRMPAFNS